MRNRIWHILDGSDPKYGAAYGIFSTVVIVTAVLAFAFSTLPDLAPAATTFLSMVEAVVIAIFALDYLARLACAPSALRYAFSFWGIIDLIAFLPALLLTGTQYSSARVLRLIQLARILKLMRMTHAIEQLNAALHEIRDQLIVFLILTLIVLYLAAVGIYLFENKAQPEVFASVPHAMWWAVATLSTVGYGDIYPVTPGGRFFTALVLLVGLAVIAVPTGLISAALVSRPEDEDEEPEKEAPEDPTERKSE